MHRDRGLSAVFIYNTPLSRQMDNSDFHEGHTMRKCSINFELDGSVY